MLFEEPHLVVPAVAQGLSFEKETSRRGEVGKNIVNI